MSTDPDSQQEVSNPEASQQPDQDDKSIDKKSDDVADPPAQEKQNPNASSELIVLSPHYDEKHHGPYVRKLEQAVCNPKVQNIALTGGYGTGKSSVIQGLIERIHSSKELKKIRPITISLPTIQVVNESDSKDDRTDRIQREIVKQLLYRSEPRKMRRSQYRRITHITTVQRAIACFIIAIFLTFAFWLLAKPDWHWSQGGSLWGYWQPAVVQTILWGLTFYIDWTWVNKPTIAIKGLQLGPAKLELEKNDFNYFDKYLEAYSAAGKTWFGWWLVEHYLPYHVNCPNGCGLGEPTRGRKDPPYFQMGYGSFDHIPDSLDTFVESLLPV